MRSTECEKVGFGNLIVELLSGVAYTERDVCLVRLWRNDIGLCGRVDRLCALWCGGKARQNTDSFKACSYKGKPIGSIIPAAIKRSKYKYVELD